MGTKKYSKYSEDLILEVQRVFDEWEPYEDIVTKEKIDPNTGEVEQEVKRKATPLPTWGNIAKRIGFNRTTLWRWNDKHPEFCEAIKKGVAKCLEEGLLTAGMAGHYNAAIAIFTAKNKLGWTDKQEVLNKYPDPIIFEDPAGNVIKKILPKAKNEN